jgi:hypothetical protein
VKTIIIVLGIAMDGFNFIVDSDRVHMDNIYQVHGEILTISSQLQDIE